MRKAVSMMAVVAAGLAAHAHGQTPSELKAAADYEKVVADTEKVRVDTAKAKADIEKVLVDTEKARIDAENAALAPLRLVPQASTSLAASEKTAEALLLNRVTIAGAAARLAEALPAAGVAPSPSVVPLVVVGTVPPSVGQWLNFQSRREELGKRLGEASEAWRKANSSMNLAMSTVIAVAATILPMLKVDTAVAGSEAKIDAVELESAIYSALEAKSYGIDYSMFNVATMADVDELLEPLKAAHAKAKADLDAFKADPDPSPKAKAAGALLVAAVEDYDKLRAFLMTETNGTLPATVIRRQRTYAQNMKARPLVFVTTTRAAATSVTRKGFFTGMFGSGSPEMAGAAILDYVVLYKDQAKRGVVSCIVAPRKLKTLAQVRPEELTRKGSGLCE